jgi:hypothetical protein
MSRLADTLRRALDEMRISAAQLERRAGLKTMTVGGILRDHHPRPERIESILAVCPRSIAHDILRAYLLDDCPDPWTPHVGIDISGSPVHPQDGTSPTTAGPPILREDSPASSPLAPDPHAHLRPISSSTRARKVLALMTAALDSGDTDLADWLAETGTLLVRPHLRDPQDTPAQNHQ